MKRFRVVSDLSDEAINCRGCEAPLSQRFCTTCGLDSQCANCGATLNSAFCGQCGTPTGVSAGTAPSFQTDGGSTGGRKRVAVVAGVLAIVVIVGGISAVLLMRDSKSESSTAGTAISESSTTTIQETTTQPVAKPTTSVTPTTRSLTVEFDANIRYYQQNYLSDVCGDSAPVAVSIKDASGLIVASGLANSIAGSSNCVYVGKFTNVPLSSFYTVSSHAGEITVSSNSISNNVIRLVQSLVGTWAPA